MLHSPQPALHQSRHILLRVQQLRTAREELRRTGKILAILAKESWQDTRPRRRSTAASSI
jgi:hypothetical protein